MKGKNTNECHPNSYEELAKQANHTSEPLWFRAVIEFTVAIAKRMADCGVSRTQLAQRLDVHPSFITKVMKGDTNISVETIAKLAHALDCEFQINLMPKASFVQDGFVDASTLDNTGGAENPAPPGFCAKIRNSGNLVEYYSPYVS